MKAWLVVAVMLLFAGCSSRTNNGTAARSELQGKVGALCASLPVWAQNQLSHTDEVMAAAAFEASNWFGELCPGMEEVAKTIQDAKLSSSPDRAQTIRQTLQALGKRR